MEAPVALLVARNTFGADLGSRDGVLRRATFRVDVNLHHAPDLF